MVAARRILRTVRARPATLGEARLVCVDGPAGSGKSTLAAALAELAPDSPVVHLDDLYDGWGGLPRVGDQLGPLLEGLSTGAPGRYRRYDWLEERYAEEVVVAPAELVVVEGVGAGSVSPGLITLLVWVEAPADLRLRRGLDRDGSAAERHWRAWLPGESAHFATYRTRERADLLVDGTDGSISGVQDG